MEVSPTAINPYIKMHHSYRVYKLSHDAILHSRSIGLPLALCCSK